MWKKFPKHKPLKDVTKKLSAEEIAKRDELGVVIKRGLDTYLEVGIAFSIIKAEALYSEHGSFRDYCAIEFGLSERHVKRLIDAAYIKKEADRVMTANRTHGSDLQPILTSERQVRPLTSIKSSKDRESVYRQLGVLAESGQKVTEKSVAFIAKQVQDSAKKEKADAADPSIPGHVRSAIAAGEEIEKHCRAIKVACTALDSLVNGPFGVYVEAGQPLDAIRKLADSIRRARPFSDCIYCLSVGKDCKGCGGHGWLTQSAFNAAPEDKQEKSKAHK